MRKMIFVGRIMSSPDGDGNVQRIVGVAAELSHGIDAVIDRDLRLDDGEHLAFGDNVINVDEYRFEFARCG